MLIDKQDIDNRVCKICISGLDEVDDELEESGGEVNQN